MTAFDNGGKRESRRVGEVVEANSMSFTAQCYRLYDSPPLGSFVRAGDPAVLIASSERAMAELGWTPQFTELDVIVSDAWTFLKNLGDRSHAARTPSI